MSATVAPTARYLITAYEWRPAMLMIGIGVGGDGIDRFLDALNLGSGEPEPPYRPGEDDIEGWLGGAPGWLRRS